MAGTASTVIPPTATAPVRFTAAWPAVGVAVLNLALACAAVALAVLNGLSFGEALTGFLVAQTIAAVAFTAVGALILRHRPGHRIGWLFLLGGFTFPQFATQYASYALVTQPGALPGGQLMAWLSLWVWIPFLVVIVVFLPLLFPDGRLPSRFARAIAGFAALGTVAGMAHRALFPGIDPSGPGITNPLGATGIGGVLTALAVVALLALGASVLGAFLSLVRRFRGSIGQARVQLKWLVFAVAVIVVAEVATPLVLQFSIGRVPDEGIAVAEAVMALWIAVAAGVAILRHRLYDIDLVIRRSLVYGVLTLAVVAVYVLVVGYFGVVLNLRGEGVSLLAAAAVAVMFAPLRTRLQRGVSRLLYGQRDEPYALLARLGRRLEDSLDPGAVLPTIAATVADALKLPYVAITLTGQDAPAATAGTAPSDGLVVVPLVFRQATVGELIVAPRGPGEDLSRADRAVLDDVARQAGVAAHAVRLTADLQRALTRLVTAREEERRRIRRDLHDGLGPQLASHTLTLDAARRLLHTDPGGADTLLTELREHSQTAVADVRRLVYDLRPPALDDRGLVPALHDFADRCCRDGLRIEFAESGRLPDLSAAVEVAAYRIVTEALTNVVRHAGADTAVVSLTADRTLRVQVEDDGSGLPDDMVAGVGLASLRERAAELGGHCVIERRTDTGGTRIVAQLPLEVPWTRSES